MSGTSWNLEMSSDFLLESARCHELENIVDFNKLLEKNKTALKPGSRSSACLPDVIK